MYSLKTLNEIQYKKEMDLEIHRLKYDSVASIKARQKVSELKRNPLTGRMYWHYYKEVS